MDFVSKRHLIYASQHILHGLHTLCPMPSRPQVAVHTSSASFPFTAIIVIGLISTSFLLMSYYIFVIKCCLNSHRADLVRRFPLSRIRDDAFASSYSPESEPRGLTESVIRLIPVICYKKELGDRDIGGERSCCECAVCLNEFQQDEKLRVIPDCSHVFHIDCIDVWLQNNANCPLCRRSISLLTGQTHDDSQVTPRPSPQDQSPHVEESIVDGFEDFVVIDLSSEHVDGDQNLEARQERDNNVEEVALQRKLEQRTMQRKARKLEKVTSMGDECVNGNYRAEDDENFLVQPIIRRSFSVDSSGDRKFHLAVEQALLQQQSEHVNEASSIEVCGGSSRAKRSIFSFGHGSRSRNSAVIPVYFDP